MAIERLVATDEESHDDRTGHHALDTQSLRWRILL
jgi:hypothetical protein